VSLRPANPWPRDLPGEGTPTLSAAEFGRIRGLVKDLTGISLSDQKQTLVVGRLGIRLRQRKVPSFAEYYRILQDPAEAEELQLAIDLITTNETSFFREADHFQIMEEHIRSLRPVPLPFKVWSAASSSGEEAYSIAMVLADILGGAEWRVLGTDISTRVLERARRGVYPIERSTGIPTRLLHAHCLKGRDTQEGMFLMGRTLRERTSFTMANLCNPLPQLGPFDVAFLRNVLIYFEPPQKLKVVHAVANQVKPGGLLIVGHAESLTGLNHGLTPLLPTVYRVP
jgi:chemotaxis protein methyltransferase CheR